jgi:hypothetical protein
MLQVPIGMEAEWASETVWTLSRREEKLSSAGSRTPAVKLLVQGFPNILGPALLPYSTKSIFQNGFAQVTTEENKTRNYIQ